MTEDEANELVRDLERAGVRVIGVEPHRDYPDRWQIRCWCEMPAHEYTITNARLFRDVVHAGLSVVLPRGALDKKT